MSHVLTRWRNGEAIRFAWAILAVAVWLVGYQQLFATCGDYVIVGNPLHDSAMHHSMGSAEEQSRASNLDHTPVSRRCHGAECSSKPGNSPVSQPRGFERGFRLELIRASFDAAVDSDLFATSSCDANSLYAHLDTESLFRPPRS